MARRFVRLSPAEAGGWDAHGAGCVFWQLPAGSAPEEGRGSAVKQEWVRRVVDDWGPCGFVAQVDGRPVGHVVYAPAGLLPGAQGLPTPPADPGTVLLASVYVEPGARGTGCGKALVHRAAHDLVQREVPVLEVIAGRSVVAHDCVLDADYVTGLGFTMQREHPVYPRLRMDLRSTLRVRNGLETAWSRLAGAVRPSRQPAPESPSSPRGAAARRTPVRR